MNYDYFCSQCDVIYEIQHGMSCEDKFKCPECENVLEKQINRSFYIAGSLKPTLADLRENNHSKKVKDFERAVRSRKRAFGHDAVGDPGDQPDPKHLVRGKVLGGQEKEVDKTVLVKAMAKDPHCVSIAKDALKKAKNAS